MFTTSFQIVRLFPTPECVTVPPLIFSTATETAPPVYPKESLTVESIVPPALTVTVPFRRPWRHAGGELQRPRIDDRPPRVRVERLVDLHRLPAGLSSPVRTLAPLSVSAAETSRSVSAGAVGDVERELITRIPVPMFTRPAITEVVPLASELIVDPPPNE